MSKFAWWAWSDGDLVPGGLLAIGNPIELEWNGWRKGKIRGQVWSNGCRGGRRFVLTAFGFFEVAKRSKGLAITATPDQLQARQRVMVRAHEDGAYVYGGVTTRAIYDDYEWAERVHLNGCTWAADRRGSTYGKEKIDEQMVLAAHLLGIEPLRGHSSPSADICRCLRTGCRSEAEAERDALVAAWKPESGPIFPASSTLC